MTAETISVTLENALSSSLSEVARPDSVSTTSLPTSNRPPFVVPRSQLYYWSQEWQAGEEEAEACIENGDFERFDNPTDAIRWLLDEDDS